MGDSMDDLFRRMSELPREKYLLLKKLDLNLKGFLKTVAAFIAGGSITSVCCGRRINDYDIYFRTQEAVAKSEEYFKLHFKEIYRTDSAITYRDENDQVLQICKLDITVGPPRGVLKKFDFTVCMGAYDFNSDTWLFHKDFFRHLALKRLVYNVENCEMPLSALFRAKKYMERGFKISAADIIKMGLQIHSLDLNNYSELRRQLLGVDTLFLKSLTDKLSERSQEAYDFKEFLEWLDYYCEQKFSQAVVDFEEE